MLIQALASPMENCKNKGQGWGWWVGGGWVGCGGWGGVWLGGEKLGGGVGWGNRLLEMEGARSREAPWGTAAEPLLKILRAWENKETDPRSANLRDKSDLKGREQKVVHTEERRKRMGFYQGK